jgi:hypothetical protein
MEETLLQYQEIVAKTLGRAPFFYFSAREDFGSFKNWFEAVAKSTEGIKAVELL